MCASVSKHKSPGVALTSLRANACTIQGDFSRVYMYILSQMSKRKVNGQYLGFITFAIRTQIQSSSHRDSVLLNHAFGPI